MLRKPLETKRTAVSQAAVESVPKPAAYELGSLESRAAARALLKAKLEPKQRIQLILGTLNEPVNLERSTCRRRLWPGGILFEMVELDGGNVDLSEKQLDKFICSFPIET